MDADSLRPIVTGLVAGAVTTALMVRSARRTPRTAAGAGVQLRYGRGLQTFACASLVVWTTFAIRNALYGSAVNSYLVAVSVPTLLAIGSGYLAINALWVSVVLDDEVIICRSPWRRTRVVAWRDVVDAHYSDLNSMWILRTRDQGKIRIGVGMIGSAALPQYLNRHRVPPRHA